MARSNDITWVGICECGQVILGQHQSNEEESEIQKEAKLEKLRTKFL